VLVTLLPNLTTNFSTECIDFITSILKLDSNKRLGRGVHGTEDIKNHPWFSNIDWVKLYNKQLEPPFKPHLKDASDTRYFDSEVTSEDPNVSFTNKKFTQIPEQDDPFEDFSFEDPYLRSSPSKSPILQDRARLQGSRRSTPVKVSKKKKNTKTHQSPQNELNLLLEPNSTDLKSPKQTPTSQNSSTKSPRKEQLEVTKEDFTSKIFHHKKLNSSPGFSGEAQPKLLRKPSAPVKSGSSERVILPRNKSGSASGKLSTNCEEEDDDNPEKCIVS